MKRLAWIASGMTLAWGVSCVHSTKPMSDTRLGERVPADSRLTDGRGSGGEPVRQVCQLDQSSKQNLDSCQRSHPGVDVSRELYKEYPSLTEPEIHKMAERVVQIFHDASAQKVEELRAAGQLKGHDVNYDARLRRVTHSKMHACAAGQLTIASDIPEKLKVGIFASPAGTSFRTYSRFANGTSFVGSDLEPDARAHSFKVIGVPGKKLTIHGEQDPNMDFVMNNSPVFFVKGPQDFITFFEGVFGQSTLGWLIGKKGFSIAFFGVRGDERRAVEDLRSRMPENLLAENFYSGIPIRWGSIAVKYGLKPVPCEGFQTQGPDLKAIYKSGPDFYRESIALQLEQQRIPACWSFGVQEQKDPWAMPIEDTTIAWSESESPFVTLAYLKIHPQEIKNPEKLDFCDSLSFNAWRVPEEFRPLGDLPKLRRAAYYISSKGRRAHNQELGIPGVVTTEPDGNEAVMMK